jgi:DNA-packaging protein gp3
MRKRDKAARPAKARTKASAKPRAKAAINDGKRDAVTGEFRQGHRFWRTRTSSGPEPLFSDAEALWAACDSYFCWCEDNPIIEEQLVTYRGATKFVSVPKMRPMTKRGLCRHLGIARTTWAEWKKERPELAAAIERAESVIWDQKFAGAAVGIFNGNLVARELGIAERVAGHDGGPVQVQDLTPQRPDHERLMVLLKPFLGPSPYEARMAAKAAAKEIAPPKRNGGAEDE